jgi:glycosyltransferase involved in cell wall biosynthesis
MRILQLTSDWKWTGPAEPLVHAVIGLRARGHEVDAAFPEAPPGHAGALAERARERGVVAAYALARGQGYVPLRDGAEVRRLRALLRARDYDVVHAQHARAQILARLAARGLRTRAISSWSHGEPIPNRLWNRWLYGPSGCDGLTVLSEGIAANARTGLGGTPERVAVVPGVVDASDFAPRAASGTLRAELGLLPDQPVIGLVARLQPHRRVELVLAGLALALREAPGLRLLVIGRGTRARQVLEEPVRRLGLGASVVRAGYRRDDYRDTIALLDALVFIVPGSDGSCRAVLETMAMEIPTIASRRGVLAETVGSGETGVVCDETPEALAAAFADLWRDPTRWQARGKAARKRILANHTVELQAERLERHYRLVTLKCDQP